MPKRAERRHAHARAKIRAAAALRKHGYDPITPRAVGRRATTPTPCSCNLCANPRRLYKGAPGRTRQEHVAALREHDE